MKTPPTMADAGLTEEDPRVTLKEEVAEHNTLALALALASDNQDSSPPELDSWKSLRVFDEERLNTEGQRFCKKLLPNAAKIAKAGETGDAHFSYDDMPVSPQDRALDFAYCEILYAAKLVPNMHPGAEIALNVMESFIPDEYLKVMSQIATEVEHFGAEFAVFRKQSLPGLMEEETAKKRMWKALTDTRSLLVRLREDVKDVCVVDLCKAVDLVYQLAVGGNGSKPYFKLRHECIKQACRTNLDLAKTEELRSLRSANVWEQLIELRDHFKECIMILREAVRISIEKQFPTRLINFMLERMENMVKKLDPAQCLEWRSDVLLSMIAEPLGKMAYLMAKGVSHTVSAQSFKQPRLGCLSTLDGVTKTCSECQKDASDIGDSLKTFLKNQHIEKMITHFLEAAKYAAFAESHLREDFFCRRTFHKHQNKMKSQLESLKGSLQEFKKEWLSPKGDENETMKPEKTEKLELLADLIQYVARYWAKKRSYERIPLDLFSSRKNGINKELHQFVKAMRELALK